MIIIEPISKEQTELYFKYLKQGNMEYRNKIILGNYRLVIYIARRCYKSGEDIEDLISIGLFGLIKAVDSFDISKNISFSTYASRCIKNEILMSYRKRRDMSSLDEEISHQDNDVSYSLKDNLKSDENIEEKIIDKVDYDKQLEVLNQSLSLISERNKTILLNYFGVGYEPMSQEELAECYGVSRAMISKIISTTLYKLNLIMNIKEEGEQVHKLLTKH